MRKKIYCVFLFLFFSLGFCNKLLYSLDLSAVTDFFYDYVDSHEGETSFRSLLIPMGGRAESLGTAFTGLADDVNYIDYNPAASSILKTTEISLFSTFSILF